jgi:hypothetical protein
MQDKILGSTNEYCTITWLLMQHFTFGEALFDQNTSTNVGTPALVT